MYRILNVRTFSTSSKVLILYSILDLAYSMLTSIWSIYLLSLMINASNIGFLSSFFIILFIFINIITIPILQYFNKRKIIIGSLFSMSIIFFLIGYFNNIYSFIILYIINVLLIVLIDNSYQIVFKTNTSLEDLNTKGGIMYTLINTAWFIGPLITAFFLTFLSIEKIFYIISLLVFFVFILTYYLNLNVKVNLEYKPYNYTYNLISYFTQKRLILPFLINAGIASWFGFVLIYFPLMIINSGLSVQYVGIFISFIMIPLILFEYLSSKYSIKYGFRKFFFLGFLGLSILSFIIFLSNNIFIQAILLIVGSIFVSLIEPIKQTFFFKSITDNEEDLYFPIYNTSKYIGSFMSRIISAFVILILPLVYSFLTISIIMFIFSLIALSVSKEMH